MKKKKPLKLLIRYRPPTCKEWEWVEETFEIGKASQLIPLLHLVSSSLPTAMGEIQERFTPHPNDEVVL